MSETNLSPEIREILRDVAHGVHGPMVSGRAAAAIVKRDLCPRCAGTGQELLDAPGVLMWGTCHGCNPPAAELQREDECPACHGAGVVELREWRGEIEGWFSSQHPCWCVRSHDKETP